jgi:hypothetical protein
MSHQLQSIGSTNRVGNDENVGIGRSFSGSLGQVTDDGGVGVEKI